MDATDPVGSPARTERETNRTASKEFPMPAPGTPAHGCGCGIEVEIAGLSHPGRVRPNNEDHFLISRMGRYMETLGTNLAPERVPPRFEESFHGVILADGVGGGRAGEVASETAIEALVQLATTSSNWIFRLDDHGVREVQERLELRISQIHAELVRKAAADADLRGFGTTMIIGLSLGDLLFLAHVGDSRVYLWRESRLQQLTRDHTLAQDLVDQGFTSVEGVSVNALRHVLTQALTGDEGPLRPEVQVLELEAGDCVLFCTDGLSDMLPDEAIAEVLGAGAPAAATCRALVDRALEAGGKDNVTVIVGRYRLEKGQTP
jgi:protein phosphatase